MAIDKEQNQTVQTDDGQQNGAHESLPPADAQELAQESQGGVSRQEYERVSQERDALLDRLARLQAEFENYRKRNAREQAEFREYAVADAVKNFLPILDNFDLALRSQKNEGAEAALRSGIELIRKQMDDVLSRLGVQVIPAQGSTFDPRVHEAIEMVESADHADHEVIDELQRGYKLKERLLRPAMVRVATNPTGK
ncbi:MAG: nucleotide exchange factor GrpE [Acidobacteria bacterium]|nr:MAG: nucleotide exchange factor GrpE [Acidobacteriota bacterium]PYY02976.1 MAG: nucleotide exchange factor GrpE [Acidobacteriota bacterium]PYY23800.1 MAG: nucleotide exchange factor GrpE [Acidobacteriota bacterium]